MKLRTTEPGSLRAGALAAALTLLPIEAAWATVSVIPYGTSTLNYDSNVYKVPSNSAAPLRDGKPVRDDYFLFSTLGIDANYLTGDQRFRLKAEGRHAAYDAATDLNHDEYLFGGGLDFTVIRNLTGVLDVSQERALTPFQNLGTTQLTISRIRDASGTVKFNFASDWSAEAGYVHQDTKTDLVTDPNFKLQQNTLSGTLGYGDASRLSGGLTGKYLSGSYTGLPADQDRFNQYSVGGLARYEATGLSNFSLELSVTSRTDSATGTTSTELTGETHYIRQLTGKTSVNLELTRIVQSYSVGSASSLLTNWRSLLNWDATDKVKVDLELSQFYQKFLAATVADVRDQGRKERLRLVKLNVTYTPLRWLIVHPFAGYEEDQSNMRSSSFNSATFGLELKVRFE